MRPEGGWVLVSGHLILADRPGLSLGLYQHILYDLISQYQTSRLYIYYLYTSSILFYFIFGAED